MSRVSDCSQATAPRPPRQATLLRRACRLQVGTAGRGDPAGPGRSHRRLAPRGCALPATRPPGRCPPRRPPGLCCAPPALPLSCPRCPSWRPRGPARETGLWPHCPAPGPPRLARARLEAQDGWSRQFSRGWGRGGDGLHAPSPQRTHDAGALAGRRRPGRGWPSLCPGGTHGWGPRERTTGRTGLSRRRDGTGSEATQDWHAWRGTQNGDRYAQCSESQDGGTTGAARIWEMKVNSKACSHCGVSQPALLLRSPRALLGTLRIQY